MKALLICQDHDESAVLSLALQRSGLSIARLRELPEALPGDSRESYDLIALVAEGRSTLADIKALRGQTRAPLIVVGERLDEATHVVALEAGADLVVQRPYSARLLIAQVRALLRRSANLPFFVLPTLTVSEVALDPGTRTVAVGQHSPRRLTQLEFRLLYALMIHRGQILPIETLIEQVWGYTGEGERDLVRGLVRRLRAKVEPDPHHPRYVLTVPGVGYTFAHEDR